MNKLIRIIVSIAQIGGGLVGLGLIGRSLLADQLPQSTVMVHVAFILVFSFGIVAGVALIKKPKLGPLLSAVFQAMQIPILGGPTLSYALFAGASFNVYKHTTGWGFDLLFGSRYSFYLNSGQPWLFGVNIVALVLFVFLVREIWRNVTPAAFSGSQPSPAPSARHYSQMGAHQAAGSPLRHSAP